MNAAALARQFTYFRTLQKNLRLYETLYGDVCGISALRRHVIEQMRKLAKLIRYGVAPVLIALLLTAAALARDDGRYAESPLRDWVRGLKDKNNVPCCDEADGEDVEGWSTDGGVYRVKVKGEWHIVPDAALLAVPNRLGYARAWIYFKDGKVQIRCFLPGAGG